MNATDKFMAVYNQFSEYGKRELILNPYGMDTMSLYVIAIEVEADTEMGKVLLRLLGFRDD